MNRTETIAMHTHLVNQRQIIAARSVSFLDKEATDKRKEQLEQIDKAISRYGQVYNPRIAKKAAQWLAIQ